MKPHKKLFIIFISAFMLKSILAMCLNRPEVFEYEEISNNILTAKGFRYNFYGVEYRSFVQPFYPIFTALIYYLTNHNHIAMLIIQSIVSSLLCFSVYFIAVRITNFTNAILAAFLTAFHPGLSVYSIFKLHPLVFDTFFYFLGISFFLNFIEKPSFKNAILSGIVFGFALLSRSTIAVFFILALIFILFLKGAKLKVKVGHVAIISIMAFLVYMPWIVRNYSVFHKLVIMQTDLGENLWVGNNTMASGSSMLSSGISVHEKMPDSMKNELDRLDELGQQRYCITSFLNFIKEDPHLFSKLFLKKFFHFWWFSPQTGILYSKLWLHIYKIYYYILTLLVMIGLYSLLKERRHFRLLVVLFVYMFSISLIHAVACIDTRHRWTVEPILIIMASVGLGRFVKFYSRSYS
jgi:4-amino-4-deoxy-L-arabinose transferase-like glycosyltransferase